MTLLRVRGVVEGLLLTFDRHFNLLMTDAEERYQATPTDSTETPPASAPIPCLQRCDDLSFLSRKAYCCRRLPQVMVRGDNVVLVSIAK